MTYPLSRASASDAKRRPLHVRGAERGFSLIEILITLAILGGIMGMVTVSMGGITLPERIRAASRKLAGMSDFIRSQAVGTATFCYLDIDFDQSAYRWRMDPPRDTRGRSTDPETGAILNIDELEEWNKGYEWEDLPRGVFFEKLWHNGKQFYNKGLQWVQYRPDGSISTYHLWLRAKIGDKPNDLERFTIIVNGLTGKSEVRKGWISFPDASESDFSQVIGNNIPGGGGR